MKKLNKKGFTLVELLAVIIILGLLMVVAASVMGNVQENSKKKTLQTETQKLLNSAYQEARAAYMIDSANFLSKMKIPGATVASKTFSGADGTYDFKITFNDNAQIISYCVTDKKYQSKAEGIEGTDAAPTANAAVVGNCS